MVSKFLKGPLFLLNYTKKIKERLSNVQIEATDKAIGTKLTKFEITNKLNHMS